MVMLKDKFKVLISFQGDLLKKVDDYRYDNHIPSRSEAVRRLLEEALSKYDTQEKKPKK